MARVIVDVVLKDEILDPQGDAISRALPRMGFTFAPTSVRQGKSFIISLDRAPSDAELKEIENAASTLLSNPVIETFTIRVEN
ncbi:MAG: phosphoribosylformylglycinamidine synthase subunit PurS [Candidatus Nanopelagicaceae bacterium]